MDVTDKLPEQDAGLEALLTKLQPLLDKGRMDNVVDVLALVSDLVDMLDGPMVEKLAEETPPSLYGLLSLLREPYTRRGLALALRTLNVIGRQ